MSENGIEVETKRSKTPRIIGALAVIILGAILGSFIYQGQTNEGGRFPFVYGLDIAGGSQLVYVADTSSVPQEDVEDLMEVLKGVIERRIDVFGVAEPNIQVETSSVVTGEARHRLVVELPGVTDTDAAIAEIGRTPLLEFKLVNENAAAAAEMAANLEAQIETSSGEGVSVTPAGGAAYVDTGLTGRYLESAELVFGQTSQGGLSNEPIVSIQFTEEGGELFEEITTEHTGEFLAIFLDGEIMSAPRINEPIAGGSAVISGNFTAEEARNLVQNLNFGALPLPISLDTTQTIGASLGEQALSAAVYAGAVGFVLLSLFMILWYRLPGTVAVVALIMYVLMMLALFKLIPVVITAAGLAGLILSIGLAVDANILIAERIKEELREGKSVEDAIREGFARAWLAIRDSNIAHIITAVILFWFGTSLIKGFALVLGIGVIVSMLSAITISRTLLMALPVNVDTKLGKFLMGSGFHK